MDAKSVAKEFSTILPEDADLTMFTIRNLTLNKPDQLVIMKILLKRKIATELLTTFLPTILLLLITFITIFFEADLFADAISVNLTIMLVMTTIFTSKIQELPPTSDTKMIDFWLIFCLLVPFSFTLVQTAIECYREDEKEESHETWAKGRGSGKVVLYNTIQLDINLDLELCNSVIVRQEM